MFKKLFNKKRKEESGIAPTVTTESVEKDINAYKKEIIELLGIQSTEIQVVDCIYESNNQVMAQLEFNRDEIPADARFNGAYYLDDRKLILLSRKVPTIEIETQTLHFRNTTDAENLYSVAHELRHVWQRKYHSDIYYNFNAIGMEVIDDIAEIDADAFALAFVFSDRTSYTKADMPNTFDDICLQATIDGGKRWTRAHEIAAQLGFDKTEKIDIARSSVDHKKINYLIMIMKLKGMI